MCLALFSIHSNVACEKISVRVFVYQFAIHNKHFVRLNDKIYQLLMFQKQHLSASLFLRLYIVFL